jgi:hypothetical protein
MAGNTTHKMEVKVAWKIIEPYNASFGFSGKPHLMA